jgi:filamentous hemagglutinin family protein
MKIFSRKAWNINSYQVTIKKSTLSLRLKQSGRKQSQQLQTNTTEGNLVLDYNILMITASNMTKSISDRSQSLPKNPSPNLSPCGGEALKSLLSFLVGNRISGSIAFLLCASTPVFADIIPDATLPVNSTVTTQGNTKVIDGGTVREQNLFHSFKEFSFSTSTPELTGDTAFFNNDASVRNIITRVTGGSLSNIDGMIKANGSANLFFLNPAGIVFGQNASLNIGGSFIGTTADSIKFVDGSEFSATKTQNIPLLTVNVPIGLQFGVAPGTIINQSQASVDGAVNTIGSPAGLQVPDGKTLALVGGDVTLAGGNLTAVNGRIELGSVADSGFVNLTEIQQGFALGYENPQNSTFGNIQISNGALVDTSGDNSGVIQLQGKNISVTDNSIVFSANLGSQTGGNLLVNATESVKLDGGSNFITLAESDGKAGDIFVRSGNLIELTGTASNTSPTAIASQVCLLSADCSSVRGSGGNLIIETGNLTIRDGAIIDASTFGVGNAGNISIKVVNLVDIIGRSPDGIVPSGIFAQVASGATDNAGNAGNLTIETRQLNVQNGAQISTTARKTGNGGNLNINASDSIFLSGFSPLATADRFDANRSGIFVGTEPEATGNVGSLNLKTGLLTVEKGARISADNFGSGLPSNSVLNVRQLRIQNGGEIKSGSFASGDGGILTVNASNSVDVVGKGTINGEVIPSTLFSQAQSSGKAGNLIINTPNFNIRDGGEVTVSGKGTGAAGNLTANSRNIRLNAGKITAETNGGEGANVNLQNVKLLTLQNQSLISAQAFNGANGGNIDIDAKNGFIVAYPNQNNDIVANAFEGNGGKINITAQSIFNLSDRLSNPTNITNDIDASSQFGTSGTVTIETPDVDPSRGLTLPPNVFADVSKQMDQICNPNQLKKDSFTITGRGSIQTNPLQVLSGEFPLPPLATLPEKNSSSTPTINIYPVAATTQNSSPRIIEAQGWIRKNGEIYLVDQVSDIHPHSSWQNRLACH